MLLQKASEDFEIILFSSIVNEMDEKEHRRIVLVEEDLINSRTACRANSYSICKLCIHVVFITFLINLFLAIPTPAPKGHKARLH